LNKIEIKPKKPNKQTNKVSVSHRMSNWFKYTKQNYYLFDYLVYVFL